MKYSRKSAKTRTTKKQRNQKLLRIGIVFLFLIIAFRLVQAVNPKEENKEGFFKKIFGKPGESKKDKEKNKDK